MAGVTLGPGTGCEVGAGIALGFQVKLPITQPGAEVLVAWGGGLTAVGCTEGLLQPQPLLLCHPLLRVIRGFPECGRG